MFSINPFTGKFDNSGYTLSDLNALYLKLDQASPQTIENGMPLYENLGGVSLSTILSTTKEPTGFPNRTDSTWSITGGTLTIAPTVTSYDIYFDGVRHTISASKQITFADTEGQHVIYFDTDDTLKEYVNPTTANWLTAIRDKCLVAIVYWDATNNLVVYQGEERHGTVMDGITHYYLHYTRGLQYVSGLGLGDFSINTGNAASVIDANAQFSVAEGSVADEDIGLTISAVGATTGLPILYRLGANGDWRLLTQSGFSVYPNPDGTTHRLMWNQLTGGSWQLTESGEDTYVLYHIFATTGKTQMLFSIMGQATYATVGQARQGAQNEIGSLLLGSLPSVEMRPIATVIFQTDKDYPNTVHARVAEAVSGGEDYVDWRANDLPRGTTPADHGSLTGLLDDDHTQYIINAPTSSTRNVIQPTEATYVPITIKGYTAQSANLLNITDSSDNIIHRVNSSGITYLFDTDSTYSSAIYAFMLDNTYTFTGDYSAASFVNFAPTIVMNEVNALVSSNCFNFAPTIKNPPGTARNLGIAVGFISQPVLTADTQTITSAQVWNFLASGSTNRANGGTLTVPAWMGFYSYLNLVDTGSTITAAYHLRIADIATKNGAVTTQYGIHISSLSKATTNYAIITAGAGNSGLGVSDPDAMLEIAASASTEECLHLKGASSQSANLLIITNSSDVEQLSFSPSQVLQFGGAASTIKVIDRADSGVGYALSITAGKANTDGVGGALNLTGGAGAGSTFGGAVNITSGSSQGGGAIALLTPEVTGTGGAITLTTSQNTSGNPTGSITLATGRTTGDSNAGSIYLTAGGTTHASGSAGHVFIQAGAATAGGDNGVIVFNNAGSNTDEYHQGDTDIYLLYLDASADRIGIGTATPATKLDVNGTITATGMTCTGVIDLGGATSFEIPNAASPTVDATGEIAYDTTDNTLIIYDGTAARVVGHDIYQANFTIYADADWTDDAVPIWQAPKDMAVTIVQVNCTCVGGTNITYNIEERAWGSLASAGTDIYSTDQTADTDGEEETSFSNAGIAAKAHLVFCPSAVSGTVSAVTGVIYYRKNVE